MIEPLIEAVRREISGAAALESVRALSRFHRVQASPGYDQGAAWLVDRLEAAGLHPEIEHVAGDGRTRVLGHLMPQGWECLSAHAVLRDDGMSRRLCDYEVEKLSLVLRSSPAHGRFQLTAVEDGTEASHYEGIDVRARVVLTAALDVHRVHRLAVVERGAAGVLACGRRLVPPARTDATDRDSLAYTSFWWDPDEPRGWGFVVSPNEGERLRDRLRTGGAPELEVRIVARAFDTLIPIISARHEPAADGGAEGEIIVVSHLCHPQQSANDNASGVAANLEAARGLKALFVRSEIPAPRRTIRHLWMPEFTGTYAWLGARPDRCDRVVAALNLDMVGEDQDACGSTFLLEHPPCFAASFAETLLREIRLRLAEVPVPDDGSGQAFTPRLGEALFSGGSDHAVFVDPALGAPCPLLIQWPDRYYHSSLDTPDRTDPRSLTLAARCAAVYAAWLAGAGSTQVAWLADSIARRARERIHSGLGHADAPRLTQAERLRARSAIRSLLRLAVSSERAETERRLVAPGLQAVDDYFEREIAPRVPPVAATPGAGCVPRRRLAAPLHYQRRLIDGISRLTAEERERWRGAELPPADLGLAFDLAWMACDGVRDLDAIEHLVWLECGRNARGEIARFFEWTARLGLSEWVQAPEGPWNSSATATATP